MSKLLVALVATLAFTWVGTDFPGHAMERTNLPGMSRTSNHEKPAETVILKPGQRLSTQDGGSLTMQGAQILLINNDGSKQLFPPGSTIAKQPNGQIGIWGTDGAAIWGTGGTTINGPK